MGRWIFSYTESDTYTYTDAFSVTVGSAVPIAVSICRSIAVAQRHAADGSYQSCAGGKWRSCVRIDRTESCCKRKRREPGLGGWRFVEGFNARRLPGQPSDQPGRDQGDRRDLGLRGS